MSRRRNWVARIRSNFDDSYFNDHVTEKNNNLATFFSWDKTAVQNFMQIRLGDVGHSVWFDMEWLFNCISKCLLAHVRLACFDCTGSINQFIVSIYPMLAPVVGFFVKNKWRMLNFGERGGRGDHVARALTRTLWISSSTKKEIRFIIKFNIDVKLM